MKDLLILEKAIFMKSGNTSFSLLKDELIEIKNKISGSNHKQLRSLLIERQRALREIDLNRDQRNELRQILDECFEKLNACRESEQIAFEELSDKNYEELSPLVEKALFEARYNEDSREAWDFCISVQNRFRDIKLRREIREMLYQQLQEAFDLLKQRRTQQQDLLEEKSVIIQKELLPQIKKLVEEAGSVIDMDDHWSKLIELQYEIKAQELTSRSRKLLLDGLQQAFEVLKNRREKKPSILEEANEGTILSAEELVAESEETASQARDFRMAFGRLKQNQQSLRDLSLPREERDFFSLRLQQAFDILKGRQEAWFKAREQESAENYDRLYPLVTNALDRARSSREFKKTREMLKNLQAQFRGIRMQAEKREKLYGRLQEAFEILNRRHNEYLATKKDIIELKVEYRLSDVELRLEKLEKEIEKDLQEIEELSEARNNPLFKKFDADPSADMRNQAEVLKAGLLRKQELLEELLHEKEELLQKKEKWADLGNKKETE